MVCTDKADNESGIFDGQNGPTAQQNKQGPAGCRLTQMVAIKQAIWVVNLDKTSPPVKGVLSLSPPGNTQTRAVPALSNIGAVNHEECTQIPFFIVKKVLPIVKYL